MKMISLKCPHCNADLDVENGLDTFFCKYCGGKIMLEGMSKAAYKARIHEKDIIHKEHILEKEIEQERYKMAYASKEKHKDWLKSILVPSLALILAFLFLILFPNYMHSSGKKEHEQKIEQLLALEAEVEQAYLDGNYEEALFKANQLYCDDGWSTEERNVWDKKRNTYISMIEEKMQEEELSDPNNIFMSVSSEDLTGEDIYEVQSMLVSLGFTNISLEPAFEKANLFNKENTVEHIVIGGKAEFTVEDYFDKDSIIIIYYYSK